MPVDRHQNMSAIRSRNTTPEWTVRRWLWHSGFRYRLNDRRLPGHPDLVLRRYRTCVFVNGCFWHGHRVVETRAGEGCEGTDEQLPIDLLSSACCKIPHTNRAFWVAKIRRNRERDQQTLERLREMGWHTVTVWECELKGAQREQTLTALVNTLREIGLRERPAPKPTEYDDYYDFELPVAAEPTFSDPYKQND